MKLAASNFAWDPPEDAQAAALLRRHGFCGVELAPGKYFPELHTAEASHVRRVRDWWRDEDLPVTALQGVMYGQSDLNLFTCPAATLRHLGYVTTLARHLGASRVVLGAPGARDPGELDPESAWDRGRTFLSQLARLAAEDGLVIALEAAPGARFLARTDETWQMVQDVNHPGLGLQFDSGALLTTGETGAAGYAQRAVHRHLSAPGLQPNLHGQEVQRILNELRATPLDGWLSAETLIPQERRLDVLDQQLRATAGLP